MVTPPILGISAAHSPTRASCSSRYATNSDSCANKKSGSLTLPDCEISRPFSTATPFQKTRALAGHSHCPNQNVACLRTSGFLFPAPLGSVSARPPPLATGSGQIRFLFYLGVWIILDRSGNCPSAFFSKQGNSLFRLLVEAAQAAARVQTLTGDVGTCHLAMRRHKSIAKVAIGGRLAVRLYWMWRNGCEYSPSLEFGSYAGQLGLGNGVK